LGRLDPRVALEFKDQSGSLVLAVHLDQVGLQDQQGLWELRASLGHLDQQDSLDCLGLPDLLVPQDSLE